MLVRPRLAEVGATWSRYRFSIFYLQRYLEHGTLSLETGRQGSPEVMAFIPVK